MTLRQKIRLSNILMVILIPPNSGELNYFKTLVVCSSKIDI